MENRRLKANITLKLDATVIREAKILAAKRGTSVSKMLANQLEQLVRHEKAYDTAMKRAVGRLNSGQDLGWSPVQDRQALYER